jgi:hypothetical protein
MKIILTEDQIKFIVNEQTPQAPSRLNSIGIERVVKTYNNPISDGYNYRLVKTYSNPLSNVVNNKYGSNNQY